MGFSLAASYTSNYDAEKENSEQPAGWLGLGWNFGFGAVTANTKGTANFEDDTFYLNNEKLIKIPGTENQYKLKNYRYVKIFRVVKDSKINYWVVYNEDGSMTIFGQVPNAISYMIGKGDWVGNVFEGDTELTPTAWHLYRQSDGFGNKVTYQYQKTDEYLKSDSWQSKYPYTKAIYPKKVIDTIGREIVFNLANKEIDEYYDPYPFPEPDSYIEFYEDKYLDNIVVYNPDKTQSQSVTFEYELVGSGQFKKRLLKSITKSIYNGGQWNPLPKTVFNYNAVSELKPAALKKIEHPTGGSTEYQYKEQELAYTKLDGSLQQDQTQVGYLGNNYMVVKHGSVKSNNYYFLGKYSVARDISVYNWDGHKWADKQDFAISTDKRNLHIHSGPDYFLVRPVQSDEFTMFQRHGDKWEKETTIKFDHQFEISGNLDLAEQTYVTEKEISVYPMQDNLFLVYGRNHHKVKAYHKKLNAQNRVEWSQVTLPKHQFSGYVRVWPSNNFFVLRHGSEGKKIDVYNWENDKWIRKNNAMNIGAGVMDVTVGDDFFIITDADKKLHIYEFKGDSWVEVQNKNLANSHLAKVSAGNNFFVLGYFNGDNVKLFERINNHQWQIESSAKTLFTSSSGHKIFDVFANNKYIAIVTRKKTDHSHTYYFTVFNKINNQWVQKKTNEKIGKVFTQGQYQLQENNWRYSDISAQVSFGKDLLTVSLLDTTYQQTESFDVIAPDNPINPNYQAYQRCNANYQACLTPCESYNTNSYGGQFPLQECQLDCGSWNNNTFCFSVNELYSSVCESFKSCLTGFASSWSNKLLSCQSQCKSDCSTAESNYVPAANYQYDQCRRGCADAYEYNRDGFSCAKCFWSDLGEICNFGECSWDKLGGGVSAARCHKDHYEYPLSKYLFNVGGSKKAYYFDGTDWQVLDDSEEDMALQFEIDQRQGTSVGFFDSRVLEYDYGFATPELYYDTIALAGPKVDKNNLPKMTKFYKSAKNRAKGNAVTYPIQSKIVDDGIGQKITYSFDFAEGKHDSTLNTVQFHKATVNMPANSGRIVNYFYNGLSKEDGSQFPDKVGGLNFEKLNGLTYKSETLAADSSKVGESYNQYEIINKGHSSFLVRGTKSETSVDGVTLFTEYEFNELNGMPKKTIVYDAKNPSKKLITESRFAFEQYPEMKVYNMLTQPFETKTYINTQLVRVNKVAYKNWKISGGGN